MFSAIDFFSLRTILPTLLVGALLFLFALSYLLVIPTVIVATRERRMIHAYVPIPDAVPAHLDFKPEFGAGTEENPYSAPRSGETSKGNYLASRDEAAARSGFQFVGAFRDGKGDFYKIRYDIWLSPDRRTLALIWEGKMGVVPAIATRLISHVGGGRTLTSTDRTLSETDLTGLSDWRSLKSAGFDDLLTFHERWLAEEAASAIPFSAEDPMADYIALRVRLVDRMVERGMARYLDEGKEYWKRSLKGGLTFALMSRRKGIDEARLNAEAKRTARSLGTTQGSVSRPVASPWLDRARVACTVLLFGGMILSFTQPRVRSAYQAYFRLGVSGVGFLGLLAINGIRSSRARRQGISR